MFTEPLPSIMTSPQSTEAPHTLPDIGNVGHPLQVGWDRVKADEEPREEEDRDGRDRPHKGRHLRG